MLVGINSNADKITRSPHLGEPVDSAEIAKWDFNVMPDGSGLPPGQGSVNEGKIVYEKQCLSCHGENGMGDSADQLAGAQMSLTSDWPEKTVGTYWPYATTLFDFIRRSMPMTAPGTLSDDEVYAVSAYILYLNGIIGKSDIMKAATLRDIKMPNRYGFINIYEKNRQHD